MPRAVVIGASMIVSSLLLAVVFNFYAAREQRAPAQQSADPQADVHLPRRSGERVVEPPQSRQRGAENDRMRETGDEGAYRAERSGSVPEA
ncbi:MAG TPA: hypothetical protein VIL28_06390 [Steroidobacteraceae bacterium]